VVDRDRPNTPGIRSVGVIGGGTAGYFAAIALKKRFPHLDVTVVESSTIPIIGVGEATTTLMPPFLHTQLGIDIVELFREVRPTYKLGIKFDWGLPGDYFFNYPFGETNTEEPYFYDGDIRTQSLTSLLMMEGKIPLFRSESGEPTSLLPRLKFAYHLNNAPFVAFLARHAARLGVKHLDAVIADVVAPDHERIERLRTSDGRDLEFDLYVDASGFRSLLLGKALDEPFTSYASSLLCDTAIVAGVPQNHGISPYTLAETMNAGWCWKIGVEGEDHRGYVFSSAFLSEEQAQAEMRAKNPGMGEPWIVRFRSGRHRSFWKGNTVAVGNAYGFVEPLESTALHMVIIEIGYLLGCLEAAGEGPPDTAFASAGVAGHWDYLRWFLALHYKFNHKLDTPFWRACRADVDISGLAPAIEHYQRHGTLTKDGSRFQTGDPAFGYEGLMIMLLGQKVDAPVRRPQVPREAWEKRLAMQRELVTRALPQAEALALLRERPDLLVEFATSPTSWCQGIAEVVSMSPRGHADDAHPRIETPARMSPLEPLITPIRAPRGGRD
jgi:tryptophan 7-halogenase